MKQLKLLSSHLNSISLPTFEVFVNVSESPPKRRRTFQLGLVIDTLQFSPNFRLAFLMLIKFSVIERHRTWPRSNLLNIWIQVESTFHVTLRGQTLNFCYTLNNSSDIRTVITLRPKNSEQQQIIKHQGPNKQIFRALPTDYSRIFPSSITGLLATSSRNK